jgi:hypothetical protein
MACAIGFWAKLNAQANEIKKINLFCAVLSAFGA